MSGRPLSFFSWFLKFNEAGFFPCLRRKVSLTLRREVLLLFEEGGFVGSSRREVFWLLKEGGCFCCSTREFFVVI